MTIGSHRVGVRVDRQCCLATQVVTLGSSVSPPEKEGGSLRRNTASVTSCLIIAILVTVHCQR